MKKILASFACLCLIMSLSACSNDTKSDSDDLASMDTGGLEGDSNTSSSDESQAGFLDDQLPEDSLGQAEEKPEVAQQEEKPAETVQEAPPPVEEKKEETAQATPPPQEEPAPVAEQKDEAPKPVVASLQKIKTTPYQEGGQLLNAVYISRPGDTYKSISQTIYGTDTRVADLKKANPGMKTPKPGQKIYYNSPKRPEDDSKLVFYYEDEGIPPSLYIAKKGDNIRKVSENLLGYKEAWKEVWSTNPVESKWTIAEGTEIHYWKGVQQAPTMAGVDGQGTQAPSNEMAQMTPPPPPTMAEQMPPPPMPEAQEMLPPPPANELPPPPPPAMAEQAPSNELPPPPTMEQAPPPPAPAPPPVAHNKISTPEEEGMDQETMMALAAAVVAAGGLAGFVVMKKKRAQKAAAAAAAEFDQVAN